MSTPYHHVNHIIIISSTHHLGKCKSSEACEFTGETLCFFSGNVASGVAEVGSLFPGAGLDLQKLPAKSAQGCSESTICTSKSQRTVTFGALLEDEVGKMCTAL